MNLSFRTFLNAAPYAAFSALVFFLLPHAYDDKGRTPAVWPDWSWLDAVAAGMVWICAAFLLAGVESRRRALDKSLLETDEAGLEYHFLAFSALKATGYMWIFAIVRWIIPGSIWGTRAKGMRWFSFDSGEYQFLVGMWVLIFLIIGYKDIADIPCDRAGNHGTGAAGEQKPAAPISSSRYNDPDWIALRHLLLEARAGRRVIIPDYLRTDPVAQCIDKYFASGEPGLLDRAAAELTGNAADPWNTLTRGTR